MRQLPYTIAGYRTPPGRVSKISLAFPMAAFYSAFLAVILSAGLRVKRNRYTTSDWCRSSLKVLLALERIGVCFEISGLEHIEGLQSPCVFVGNHMSTLETVVLPGLIQPLKDVTFIVKNTLLNYPVFRDILISRDPIVVHRDNPRRDLQTVLKEGAERLGRGISIIVFPQTTRYTSFEPSQFNTLGIKLAQRADVPVVPLALLTDAWRNGKYLKDFGPIDRSKKVFFAFGKPIKIHGRGMDAHRATLEFIQRKISMWQGCRRSCA